MGRGTGNASPAKGLRAGAGHPLGGWAVRCCGLNRSAGGNPMVWPGTAQSAQADEPPPTTALCSAVWWFGSTDSAACSALLPPGHPLNNTAQRCKWSVSQSSVGFSERPHPLPRKGGTYRVPAAAGDGSGRRRRGTGYPTRYGGCPGGWCGSGRGLPWAAPPPLCAKRSTEPPRPPRRGGRFLGCRLPPRSPHRGAFLALGGHMA